MARSILVAEDEEVFQLLIKLALEASGYNGTLDIVDDGMELMDFLNHRGKHSGSKIPDLIILDLTMPKKNGREALREVKADPSLSVIPIAILSCSDSEKDLQLSRDFGCHFIQKPQSYPQWMNAMQGLLKSYGS